jgi:hypothetical protein
MQAFLVDLKNQPGELARVTEAIAAKGVNITGFSGATCGDSGRVAVMTSDHATTRAALAESGFKFTEMAATDTALRHEPGSLAKATRRLADAGINVEAAMAIKGGEGNEVHVAFVTSDAAKAREVLSAAGMIAR